MAIKRLLLALYIGKSTPKRIKDPKVLDALQSVEVNQADDGAADFQQGFQLSFGAERATDSSPDYPLLRKSLLNPGNRVIITTAVNTKAVVLMDGIITHQQLVFDVAQGQNTLVVMGRDLSVLMDLEEKRVGYAGMSQQQVVEKILKGYDVKPKVTAPRIQSQEHMPFQTGTDRAYLRSLAAANGYIFALLPGPQPKQSVAYWGPPDRSGRPHPALTVNMAGDTNVESFQMAYDALAPTQAVRAQAGKDRPTLVETTKSKIEPALAKRPALSSNKKLLRRRWLGAAGPDDSEAEAQAQGLVDLAAEQVVTVKGVLDAHAYGGVLRAPGLVGVRGVGETYDGEYYIKAVKHTLTREGHKQEFTLTREGVTSKKKRVKA